MKKAYIILLLAMCLSLMAFPLSAMADEGETCSITVSAGDAVLAEEYAAANVVADIYRIADADKLPAVDAEDYTLLPLYSELTIPGADDETGWRTFASEAAELALTEGTPIVTGATLDTVISADDAGESLAPGLYLVAARGSELAEYTAAAEDGIATLARTDVWEYSFTPALVSLPAVSTEGGPEYSASTTLKSARTRRTGALELVKELMTWEASEPATFVFSVEAVLDGETVFSDVSAMTFTGAGRRSLRLEGLPVGAVVTASEIYSGAHYAPVTTDAVQTAAISVEEAQVVFVNDYSGTPTGGHGIVNRFYHDGETWIWTQDADSGAGGAAS